MALETEEHVYYPSMRRAVADTASITSRLLARKTLSAMQRSRHVMEEQLYYSGLQAKDVAALAIGSAIATSVGVVLDSYGNQMTEQLSDTVRLLPTIPDPIEALSRFIESVNETVWPDSYPTPRG